MEALFSMLARSGGARCVVVSDEPSGLRALIVIDDTTLGPAAGGVRTKLYSSPEEGLADALALARAMTLKCSLAGLPAGGGKAVVFEHEGLDRAKAFRRLGEVVEELGGVFRTAGDLGTTAEDLAVMASASRFVHTDERGLAQAVARGMLRAVEACAAVRGREIPGLRVVIQGAGSIGARVARLFGEQGMIVTLADVDEARAREVAASIAGAQVVSAKDALLQEADVIAPCAVGGVITESVAKNLRAWAICGAANNALASVDVAKVLASRGVLHVPDPIASAGAVIDGIGASVMKLLDRTPLIDKLGETAREVLEESLSSGRLPIDVAQARAQSRIEEAKRAGRSVIDLS